MSKQHFSFWKLRLIALLGLCWLPLAATAANSITHYGITWTFSSDRPTGTFVNGEPWVLGPVTIISINPNPSQSEQGVQHGSMVNPVPNKNFGFDSNAQISRDSVYETAKNASLSLPLTLNAGDVLVSAKSQLGFYPTWLKTLCALSVLESAPASGSFRPGIYGNDRTVRWNISQLNWGILKNYAAIPSTPSKQSIAAQMPPLPWFEWSGVWSGQSLQPTDNTADGNKQYGRETAAKFGEVGLWLNTNQPLEDKKPIAIQMVQNGLDIYEYVKHHGDGAFYHDGGHKCGRKLPLVIAAMMLNDPNIMAMAANPDIFQEDTQTWIVTQADVGRDIDDSYPGWPNPETYRQEDVGIAEWGIRHRWQPQQDNRNWSTGYRTTNGNGMMGPWMAAYLMGAQTVWNHPAAFSYMQRYKTAEGFGGSTFSQSVFNKEMWDAHIKTAAVSVPSQPTGPSKPQGLRIVE